MPGRSSSQGTRFPTCASGHVHSIQAHFRPKHELWWKDGSSASQAEDTTHLSSTPTSQMRGETHDVKFDSTRLNSSYPRSVDEKIEDAASRHFWQSKELGAASVVASGSTKTGWKAQIDMWSASCGLRKQREEALYASLDWVEPDRDLVWSEAAADWVLFRDLVTKCVTDLPPSHPL